MDGSATMPGGGCLEDDEDNLDFVDVVVVEDMGKDGGMVGGSRECRVYVGRDWTVRRRLDRKKSV